MKNKSISIITIILLVILGFSIWNLWNFSKNNLSEVSSNASKTLLTKKYNYLFKQSSDKKTDNPPSNLIKQIEDAYQSKKNWQVLKDEIGKSSLFILAEPVKKKKKPVEIKSPKPKITEDKKKIEPVKPPDNPYKLLAILDNDYNSSALLVNNYNNHNQLVRQGEEVNGFFVKKIEEQRVILTKEGFVFILAFNKITIQKEKELLNGTDNRNKTD